MKKSYFLACIHICLAIMPCSLPGQYTCIGSFSEFVLNSNHIYASFLPRGSRFTDGAEAGFRVPYPATLDLSTIFASSLWIGGFDDAGNLKMATELFPSLNEPDFSVGPLSSIGVPLDSVCSHYDYAWSVYYEDIQAHRADFLEDFVVDDTVKAVFAWPGKGNKHFESYFGFELPFDIQGLAPFHDWNQNGIYDPENGDYPSVSFSLYVQDYIPDQMLWMVFNDVDPGDTIGPRPLRFEFQLTAFAFHCEDNEILNNTIFNQYKVINRSVVSLDSAFFGTWTDYDLGCYEDDFVGSDSTRNTEFVYNGDPADGDENFICSSGQSTYASHPPVQSMTYLDHPMHSFIAPMPFSEEGIERYRLLNGQWEDGTPIRPSGNGYFPNGTLAPTRFLYHGDPRDSTSWAAVNILDGGEDVKAVSSVYLGRMDPGAVKFVTTAHMFHSNPDTGYLGHITLMQQNIDSLMSMLDDPVWPCIPYKVCSADDCVWPGDMDHNGIADQSDYLPWAVFNGATGTARNGLISWRGHYSEEWNSNLDGVNAKHVDADGNGIVNENDIELHFRYLFQTNPSYTDEVTYTPGNDLILSALPIDDQGRIRNFAVKAGHDLGDILGLTFEVEFDTALFRKTFPFNLWPPDSARLIFNAPYDPAAFIKFSAVQTNHQAIDIDSGFAFVRMPGSGFTIRQGLPIPDSTIMRIRNIKGIDAEGVDHHLGSGELVVYKEGFMTGSVPVPEDLVRIYPNPTHRFISIDQDQVSGFRMYDLHGKLVKTIIPADGYKPVDLGELLPGLYVLQSEKTGQIYKVIRL